MDAETEASSNASNDWSSTAALNRTVALVIGHRVDVQLTDGSVFRGILHTALFKENLGVVLKMAKKIKKSGNHIDNIRGDITPTLVIFATDIAQVIAEDLLLPSEEDHPADVLGQKGETFGSNDARNFDAEREGKSESLNSMEISSDRLQDEESKSDQNRLCGYKGQDEGVAMTHEDVDSLSLPGIVMVESKGMHSGIAEYPGGDSEVKQKSPALSDDEGQLSATAPPGMEQELESNPSKDIHCPSSPAVAPHSSTPMMRNQELELPSGNASHGLETSSSKTHSHDPSTEMDALVTIPSSSVCPSLLSAAESSSSLCTDSSQSPTGVVPSRNSMHDQNPKEYRLNPGANTFSPSSTNPNPTSPGVSNISYRPGQFDLPLASQMPDSNLAYASYTSMYAQPYDLGYGSYASSVPYPHHLSGPVVRYIAPYPPQAAAPQYLHQSAQSVMDPTAMQAVQPMAITYPVYSPKQQGGVPQPQYYMAPYGVQQYVMPNPYPIPPTYPPFRANSEGEGRGGPRSGGPRSKNPR